jgi:type IV pilus assembly protein PilA
MFLQNLRAKVGARLNGDSESGFTLIELLVVMLILGILAAIALPAFFNQKDKAGDAKVKEYAHSAQVAMETYATDNEGEYTDVTVDILQEIEPSLTSVEDADIALAGGAGGEDPGNNNYRITITSPSTENTFSVNNNAGTVTFPCTAAGTGGCPGSGGGVSSWGG